MKNNIIKKLSMLLLFAIIAFKCYSAPSISSFSIYPTYLQSGAIKVYSNANSTFVATYAFDRQMSGTGYENVHMQARLIVKSNGQDIDISFNYNGESTIKTITTDNFVNASNGLPSYFAGYFDVQATIPLIHNQGRVYLQFRYLLNGNWTDWKNSNVNFGTVVVGELPIAGPGSPPQTNPPVAGSVPIYFYGQEFGGVSMTTQWGGYSNEYWIHGKNKGGYTLFSGVIGFSAASHFSNAKPIYRYVNSNIGDNYYTLKQQSYTGYNYVNISFYAYETAQANTVPVYSYLVWNEFHYYTTEAGFAQDGYLYEGVAYHILNNQSPQPLPGSVKWYQYFHPGVGNHYYTKNSGNYPGYVFEGVLGHVFSQQQPGTVALYQYYNPTVVDHCYYTANTNIPGYQNQGVSCYVYTSQQPGTIPIYGYFNPNSGDHYYTRSTQTPSGYVAEGIQFYVSA